MEVSKQSDTMWSESIKKDDDDVENPSSPYTMMMMNNQSAESKRGLTKSMRKSSMMNVEKTLLQTLAIDEGSADSEDNSSIVKMESLLFKFLSGDGNDATDVFNSDNWDENVDEEGKVLLKRMIEKEFPDKDQRPTFSQLVNFGEMDSNRSLYDPGDWVEIEGLDMKWRLDMITRVIRTAPNDWDWNDPANEGKEPEWTFTYNAGSERNVEAYDMRASETGLKILFGTRPWVWQQYAMLKLESKMRFQEGHQDDFMELDIQKYCAELWEKWIEHPSNIDFKELYFDPRIGERGRLLLTNHIQKPFNLIDTMGEEHNEWNFEEDDNINVFTYMSLFGSGIIMSSFVLTVQVVIPILLAMEAYRNAEVCEKGVELDSSVILGKITSLTIFVYYSFSIIPDTYANFFNVVGAADSVYSRLLSLRRELWLQADDSLLQMIGYKIDIYMNTSYETLLSILNIYVILNTSEPIEIVLNSLAFTFIARMDEDLVKSGWYDPNKRWATSGAMTVCMQTYLKLNALSRRTLFSEAFGIPDELLQDLDTGDGKFVNNPGLAAIDAKDSAYMNDEEKIKLMFLNAAKDSGNRTALDEYRKPDKYFGLIEKTFNCLSFTRFYPVFGRFKAYQTWSMWHQLLYLAPVPNLDEIFDEDGVRILSEKVDKDETPLLNFYPEEEGVGDWTLFWRHFRDVLLFRDLSRSTKESFHVGIVTVLYRYLDGIVFNWFTYFVHILFPIYLIFGYYEVIYNIVTRECTKPINTVIDWIM